MVVFTIFVVSASETFSFIVVLGGGILTFVPIVFVHPVRVKVLRPLNLIAMAAWSIGGLVALYFNLNSPQWVDGIIIASSLYLFSIGFILQLMGKLR